LYQPRESRGVVGTIATGVDLQSGSPENICAAVWSIAFGAVKVPGVEIIQNAGPVQPIVNQRVNYDQLCASCPPKGITRPSAEQERDQRQRQDLVRRAVNMPHRIDDGGSIRFFGSG
jgi:hypothetical protein